MLRSTQFMIRLAAIVPLAIAFTPASGAAPAGDFQMHTNQGDLVGHSNQESRWQELLGRPGPVVMPSTWSPSFSVSPLDPLAHGNSPATAPPTPNLPGPGTMAVLGLAWLCAPARRRR